MKRYALAAIVAASITAGGLTPSATGPAGAEAASLPGGKGNVHPKVESVLTELADRYAAGPLRAQAFVRDRAIPGVERNKVTVYIVAERDGGLSAAGSDALRGFGAEIVKSAGRLVKARIPLDAVRRIADSVPGVAFIQLPDRPHPLAVTSEGVALTQASRYHASGVIGTGVKVAVIDVGFAGLSTAISSGDISPQAVRVDCTGIGCASTPTTFDAGEVESHGTAVAEIVQDMAPGAELHLIKVADSLDLSDAKDYCIANGIRIINHSAGWINTNFYDGLCHAAFLNPVCTADAAAAGGILWVNAAGNFARTHYEATFTDANSDGIHDQDISLTAVAGEYIDAYLTWDAWPTTNQDYDLYLVDSDNNVVAASEGIQDGSQRPREGLAGITPVAATYRLRIVKYGVASNLKFELFSSANNLTPSVAATSIAGPADAASVVAVAAIDQAAWTTGPQESYSSRGPTTDGRVKPDISGPDAVTTTTYSGYRFGGTSASSPHVAGAAALLLSRNPAYTVSEVRNVLAVSAIDMGSPGADPVYGAGRLSLQSAPSAPVLVSPADGSTGHPTTVAFTWRKSTDPDGDPLSYNLYVGTDNTFAAVIPIVVPGSVSPTGRAAAGGPGVLPLFMFGIVAAIGVSRRRTRTVLGLAAALAVGAALACCGGDDGNGGIFGNEPVTTVSSAVANLRPGTTYYWKVSAADGHGNTTDSATYGFRTAP